MTIATKRLGWCHQKNAKRHRRRVKANRWHRRGKLGRWLDIFALACCLTLHHYASLANCPKSSRDSAINGCRTPPQLTASIQPFKSSSLHFILTAQCGRAWHEVRRFGRLCPASIKCKEEDLNDLCLLDDSNPKKRRFWTELWHTEKAVTIAAKVGLVSSWGQ